MNFNRSNSKKAQRVPQIYYNQQPYSSISKLLIYGTLVPLTVVGLKGAEIPAVAIHNETNKLNNLTKKLIISTTNETVILLP